jgi:parvulin-like peptidyl-prolyl isomerase
MTNTSIRSHALRALVSAATVCISGYALAQTPPARPAAPKAAAPAPAPAVRAPVAPAPAAVTPVSASADDVVARVGSTDITAEQVRAFVATLDPREQAALLRDPAQLGQAVRIMIASQLALKEATEKKWDQQPNVVAALQKVRDNAVTQSYLQSVSVPPSSFPSDAEIEKAYDGAKSAFIVPRQFQLAQIFVSLAKDADKAAEDKAKKKLADVQAKLKQAGADFGAVASTESDDRDTAARKGEIGWIPESQIKPEIKTQVMGLAKNAISEPVKLDDGWHILKLVDTKASYTRPLTEVKEVLVQRLRAQQAEANYRGYLARLLEQNPPAINEIALSKAFADPAHAATR